CKFRNVKCRRECGHTVMASMLEQHEQEHCRLSQHPCVFGCGLKIANVDMNSHIKKDCPKRKVRCRVSCGAWVEAATLEHHETEVCDRPCCWEGCNVRLGPAARRETHEHFLCPHRVVPCPNGCGIRGLPSWLEKAHASYHCPKRPVACPRGCGASKLVDEDLPKHLLTEGGSCPERLQRC
ncbi:unnamed protein product, partial [Choristocarpus tenellus]